MIEFNDKLEQIEIKECLSFEHHVLPIFNELKGEIEYQHESKVPEDLNDVEKYDYEKEEDFLTYKLSHEDKMEMLHYIEDEYERNSNYFDGASIFDEDSIRTCVWAWITDNFDVEAE